MVLPWFELHTSGISDLDEKVLPLFQQGPQILFKSGLRFTLRLSRYCAFNVPVVYMARDLMILMRATFITRALKWQRAKRVPFVPKTV